MRILYCAIDQTVPGTKGGSVLTFPLSAGFPRIENVLDEWAATAPAARWSYANVYDADGWTLWAVRQTGPTSWSAPELVPAVDPGSAAVLQGGGLIYTGSASGVTAVLASGRDTTGPLVDLPRPDRIQLRTPVQMRPPP